MTTQIPEASLVNRGVYRIVSRNLIVGAWNASEREFIGIREKFGSKYLFGEYHYDTGAPLGTAGAREYLMDLPEGMQLSEDSQPLFDFLTEIEKPIIAELIEEDRKERLEQESLAFRPMTKDEFDREQRVEMVRQWHRDNPEQPWREYMARLQEAIKGETNG